MTKREFRDTLEDLLEIPRGTLRDADTRDSVRMWSSLVDVQILFLLESELNLEDPQTIAYDSVGDLMAALDGRGVFAV